MQRNQELPNQRHEWSYGLGEVKEQQLQLPYKQKAKG